MTETASSMYPIFSRKLASGASAPFSRLMRGVFMPEKLKSAFSVKIDTSSSSGIVENLILRLLGSSPDFRLARALSGASVTETEGPSVPDRVAFPCSAI